MRQLKQNRGALKQMSVQQLERAFLWLASPVCPLPPELNRLSLSKDDWLCLNRMLNALLEEREHYPLQ